MARGSALDDLIRLGTRLHWAVALGAAGVAWAGFDYLAIRWNYGQPLSADFLRSGAAGYLLLGTICYYLSYVVPIALLIGAVVGGFSRWRRGKLFAKASADPRALSHGMTWADFERIAADAFKANGYSVEERGGACADGGVDFIATRDSRRFLVQCKQWKTRKVDVATVRELLGVISAGAADGGFIVAAGGFTSKAEQFAAGSPVQLVDRDSLHGLIRAPGASIKKIPSAGAAATDAVRVAIPTCPHCQRPMVKRVAKRGKSAGREFWGCSAYPACSGIRKLA